MANVQQQTETISPKAKPAWTRGSGLFGRPILVGPEGQWSFVPAGNITNAEAGVVVDLIIDAAFGAETPEEAFWRAKAAWLNEQLKAAKDALDDARNCADNADREVAFVSGQRDALRAERDAWKTTAEMNARSGAAWAAHADDVADKIAEALPGMLPLGFPVERIQARVREMGDIASKGEPVEALDLPGVWRKPATTALPGQRYSRQDAIRTSLAQAAE